MTTLQQLLVYLDKTKVGEIIRFSDDRTMFSFDQEYKNASPKKTLSLSFKAADNHSLIEPKRPRSQRLEPFFSNLLPEGHLREYLASRFNVKSSREFFLAAALGHDLPGAVRLELVGNPDDDSPHTAIESNEKQDEAFRFSLAGVQLKFSAVLEGSGRLTIPINGRGGSWIVKLPAGRFQNVPEAEFAMMTLAKSFGLNVPEFKLIPTRAIENLPEEFSTSLGESFVVKRFDRTDDGGKVHMEDFAQIFGVYSSAKYQVGHYGNIAEVLWVEAGEASLNEYLRRLVFTIGIGNGDMHLKNWSVLYPDHFTPVLSPAYDFVPTIAFMESQRLALNLGGTKNFHEIDDDKFRKLASSAKLPERLLMNTVKEAVDHFKEVWNSSRDEVLLSADMIDLIDRHINSVPLFNPQFRIAVQQADASKARVIGDVEYDSAVPVSQLILENRLGDRMEIMEEKRIRPWLIVRHLARSAPDFAKLSPITILAGETLFRAWRQDTYITVPRSAVEESGVIKNVHVWDMKGPFKPSYWKKITSAFENDSNLTLDINEQGARPLLTFNARVFNIENIHRNEDGETQANVRISMKANGALFSNFQGAVRIMIPENVEDIGRKIYAAFDHAEWRADIFGNTGEGYGGTKKVKMAREGQIVEVHLDAQVDTDFNGSKTVIRIVVRAKDFPVWREAQDEAQQLAKAVNDVIAGNVSEKVKKRLQN